MIEGTCDTSFLTKYVHPGDEIRNCFGTITLTYEPTQALLISWTFEEKEEFPTSIISGDERSVSPEDEGPHFNKIIVSRESWYYTAVFDQNSELPGWTVSISFNHMARGDLFFTKPDLLMVTLHSPDGRKYGGIIEKERYLGILREGTLLADYSNKNFKVSFEESYIVGKAPNWHVHIEGDNIDPEHSIKIDLQVFAPSSPFWIHSNRLIDKGKGKVASYIFTGCQITNGTVTIDGLKYSVTGVGHHEHSWSTGLLKLLIKGWDICHMTLENGWNIYYTNYYLLPQLRSTMNSKYNPFATCIITTDNGNTLTRLEDVDIKITTSDKAILLLNLPLETQVTARSANTQILLKTFNILLGLDISADNTYDHTWRGFKHVGMKIGRSTISGSITWSDDDGDHDIDLNGIGTIWNMRH
jgi:predicted secreted hydrolase